MTLALLALASVFFICVAMTKITEHTSFDGLPDRFSCLVDGRLRWESDTNLDGHVDQIDDFDADGYRTRTVRDTDHDGIADLLVLYRDGAPVYTTRASTSALAASPPSQHGNSLNDPFARETRVVEKVKKFDPLAGLLLGSHLSGAAPCRGSPPMTASRRVSAALTSCSQFDLASDGSRGPPIVEPTSL